MKRLYILLVLMLCAMMALSAQAIEAAPGDTVTLPIKVSSADASMLVLDLSVDDSVFELKSVNSLIGGYGSVDGSTGKISLMNGDIM